MSFHIWSVFFSRERFMCTEISSHFNEILSWLVVPESVELFHLNLTGTTTPFLEDSRCITARISNETWQMAVGAENFSQRNYREQRNTHFMFSILVSTTCLTVLQIANILYVYFRTICVVLRT